MKIIKKKAKKVGVVTFLSPILITVGGGAAWGAWIVEPDNTIESPVTEWFIRLFFAFVGLCLLGAGVYCLVFGVKRLIQRKPYVVIDEKGITTRLKLAYTEEIPFKNIQRAYVKTWMDSNHYLAIVLKDDEAHLKQLPTYARWDKGFERLFGFETVMIDLSSEGVEFIEEIVDEIHEKIHLDPEENRLYPGSWA